MPVPLKGIDGQQLAKLLLRHPIIHILGEFCYWFTLMTIFGDLTERFAPSWGNPFQASSYWFALWMAGGLWFFDRRRMQKRLAAPEGSARDELNFGASDGPA